MVKRSPLGSAPSRTIGARPVRSISFQLAPPSVDRSIFPGVLQSPTVARHAVLEDTAKTSSCPGAGSIGWLDDVAPFEALGLGEVVCSVAAEGEGVMVGDNLGAGRALSPRS